MFDREKKRKTLVALTYAANLSFVMTVDENGGLDLEGPIFRTEEQVKRHQEAVELDQKIKELGIDLPIFNHKVELMLDKYANVERKNSISTPYTASDIQELVNAKREDLVNSGKFRESSVLESIYAAEVKAGLRYKDAGKDY